MTDDPSASLKLHVHYRFASEKNRVAHTQLKRDSTAGAFSVAGLLRPVAREGEISPSAPQQILRQDSRGSEDAASRCYFGKHFNPGCISYHMHLFFQDLWHGCATSLKSCYAPFTFASATACKLLRGRSAF